MKSLMQQTGETATDFWNDSCDAGHLSEAIEHGAVGATSNPVIVCEVVKSASEVWNPVIDRLIAENPTATEERIGWLLIAEVGRPALDVLKPVFERSNGRRGRLSIQVNPTYFRDAEAMTRQAVDISAIAPNVTVKLPAVEAGLRAMEEVVARGIVVMPTVSFTVSQAIAAAEAIERGLDRAHKAGIDISGMRPNVAIMVGRLDDHLKRGMDAEKNTVDPGVLEWAGVAVFKRAYRLFRERGFRSILLSAAYRNHMHWSEFIGGELTVSIPYKWWKRFNASSVEVRERIDSPVRADIIDTLQSAFADFRRAYEPGGMKPDEFASFGASAHTLNQFTNAYYDMLSLVRNRLLA